MFYPMTITEHSSLIGAYRLFTLTWNLISHNNVNCVNTGPLEMPLQYTVFSDSQLAIELILVSKTIPVESDCQ